MKYQGVGSSPEFQELWEAMTVTHLPHLTPPKTRLLSSSPWRHWFLLPLLLGAVLLVSQEDLCLPPFSPSPVLHRCSCQAGVQGWVLLHWGEEQSEDADIKHHKSSQLCSYWQGCPHVCDKPSLGSGSSAGMWWLFKLGWVFLISSYTK